MKPMKYSFIENNTSRRTRFNKRKQGIVKKLTELVTLCDVKACGIIYSPHKSDPEAWPSREGVEEVVSKFMEVSMKDRTKKMVDQEAFLRVRITKEKAQLQKVRNENRNFQIQDIMFDCLKGDINVHKLGEKDLKDLSSFIDKYLNQLTCKIENLKEDGEVGESSSSSLPPLVFGDAVANPFKCYDHKHQYQNQQKVIQLQHDALLDFCGQIPQKIHDFNMKMKMNLNSNQNMSLDLNQNLNVEEDGDGSHHQPETDGLATTVADACAPNITNNLES